MSSSEWQEDYASFGFKDQTSYDEPVGGSLNTYAWLKCEPPQFSWGAREMEELNLLTGQVGAARIRKAGSRHGKTFTIRTPVRSQAASYDGTGTPSLPPEMQLAKEIFGAAFVGTYHAAELADPPGDAKTWKVTDAELAPGAMYAVGEDAETVVAIGWVQSQTGTDVTLFEDTIAVANEGSHIYPCVTLYPANVEPTPKEFRWVGDNGEFDVTLIGCVPTQARFTFDSGKIIMMEATYRFTDYTWGNSGALQDPAEYQQIAALMGINNSRFSLNGPAEGTPDPDGTCGAGNVVLEVTLEQTDRKCHSGRQGVKSVRTVRRDFQLSFDIPHTTDLVSDSLLFDDSLENETPISVSLVSGNKVGKLVGFLMPAGRVIAQTELVVLDRVMGWRVTMAPAEYHGDGSDDDAGNSVCRLAIG